MYLAAIVFGAMVGSFLNVCILRVPKEESIVFPASHCMKCRKVLAWFDNIPILSFLFLKGRCRQCHKKISWQYPIVEAMTALTFTGFYVYFGLTVQGAVYLVLTLALLVQSVIDFRYQIIPDGITLPGIVVGVLLSGFFPSLHGQSVWWMGLKASLIGLFLGGGFLYALGTIAEWILKKEAMGGGDVKLLAMIGSLLGWHGVLWTLFLSSLLGAVIGLYFKLKTGEEKIPFGPYIAMGAVSYLFFGPTVFNAYFDILKF